MIKVDETDYRQEQFHLRCLQVSWFSSRGIAPPPEFYPPEKLAPAKLTPRSLLLPRKITTKNYFASLFISYFALLSFLSKI